MWVLVWVVLFLVVAYAALILVIVRVSLHPPRTPVFLSPGALGADQEEIIFEGREGLALRGWWLPRAEAKGAILFCHGYLMNRAEPAALAYDLWKAGYAGLLFDFPGHGTSPGARTGLGWSERHDVVKALAELKRRAPGLPIIVWGSSMGAAALAFGCREANVVPDAMILDSCYSQLKVAAGGWWTFIGGAWLRRFLRPTTWLTPLYLDVPLARVDVAEALRAISPPRVLIVHGDADTLAPLSEAERNHQACPGSELAVFPGRNHAEARWLDPAEYRRRVMSFLDESQPS